MNKCCTCRNLGQSKTLIENFNVIGRNKCSDDSGKNITRTCSDWLTGPQAAATTVTPEVGSPYVRFTGSIPMALGQRLNTMFGVPVRVIHSWLGSQPISSWIGNGEASARFAALKTTMAAALPLINRTSIDLLVWCQGENDFNRTDNQYIADFATLRTMLLRQSWMSAKVPTVLMGLVEGGDTAARNTALQSIAANTPRTVFASGSGLSADGPLQHYTAAAQWTMGHDRMGDALRKVWSHHKSHGAGVRSACC